MFVLLLCFFALHSCKICDISVTSDSAAVFSNSSLITIKLCFILFVISCYTITKRVNK
jgi:hypothetical protein